MADHASPHEALTACPNCETAFDAAAAPPRYCPHCGQRTLLHPPTLAEFVHEFLGHYVALEGELWRSLRLLLRHPGRLTREYLAGRRRRYVLPLRMYLSASFVFFLVVKLMPTGNGIEAPPAPGAIGSRAGTAIAQPASGGKFGAADLCGSASSPACGWLSRHTQRSRQELDVDPLRAESEFKAHFYGKAPYAMFLMLPLFAGALALTYRRRRLPYGEHFVFCMHLSSFWFLCAALGFALPAPAGLVAFLACAAYAVRALQVVYGGRWLPTLARATLIGIAYCALLLVVIVAMTFAVVLAE